MRKVLLIAFHFPPLIGSSGIQRTLGYARHLPKYGWQPIVLSAHPRAYPQINEQANGALPPELIIKRAFALDTSKHLSIKGHYPRALALPDRWMSWRWDAVRAGMQLIREHAPEAIWSTYPIATAHQIGAQLAQKSGLPWIADFRDPMLQADYPHDEHVREAFAQVEQQIFTTARCATFTTPGAQRLYRERYMPSGWSEERFVLIENGYDEESFHGLTAQHPNYTEGEVVLLHSGIVYKSERDPRAFFRALAQLRQEHFPHIDRLKLRFRAAVHEDFIRQCAQEAGISDMIEIAPAIAYRDALAEMLNAHALLVLQANNCNDQIPAKSYEYLRAQRPLLVLADPAGDTGALFTQIEGVSVAPLEHTEQILSCLRPFLSTLFAGQAPLPALSSAQRYDRARQAGDLAALLETLPTK